jgi:hypothetical protein
MRIELLAACYSQGNRQVCEVLIPVPYHHVCAADHAGMHGVLP